MIKLLPRLCIIIIWMISISRCRSDHIPTVKTPLGQINGYFKTSAEGRQYAAYQGIPYAYPPVGELRFRPPSPVLKYTTVINATKASEACAQHSFVNENLIGQEDCLYMSIYTPVISAANDSLPVIVWFHGGGFQIGTSSNDGAKYLIDRNLILVTVNYRLGPFGFLSTSPYSNVIPGNMGLKDQSVALKWVADNIRYFGGDPTRVTLTGISAGGASVHYHYLSPMSAGRFRNGISFSGTALAPWAYANDTYETTKLLAKALNCPTITPLAIDKCLHDKSANEITTAVKSLQSKLYFPYFMFPPVAENATENYFINDTPTNIIQSGRAYDAPWITGIVSDEGLYVIAGFALNESKMEYTEKNWESVAPYMLHYQNVLPASRQAEVAELAKKHYLADKPFTTDRSVVKNLAQLTGDNQIVTSVIRAAKLQAKFYTNPVWLYYYSYRAAQSFSDYLSSTTENLGVCHNDDVFLVIENQYIDPTTTENDKAMLQDMLDFWNSVARDGKPNLGKDWPKLNSTSEKLPYMHIAGPGNFTLQSSDNLGEIQFWDSIGL